MENLHFFTGNIKIWLFAPYVNLQLISPNLMFTSPRKKKTLLHTWRRFQIECPFTTATQKSNSVYGFYLWSSNKLSVYSLGLLSANVYNVSDNHVTDFPALPPLYFPPLTKMYLEITWQFKIAGVDFSGSVLLTS